MNKSEDYNMEPEFRIAGAEDFAAIAEVFARAVHHTCAQGINQWDDLYPDEKLLKADIADKQMYVLCQSGDIVSAVVINEEYEEGYSIGRWNGSDKFAVVHRLCVDSKHQNCGFGKRTMLHVEKFVKGKGYKSIRLDAFMQNPYASRLYRKLGYDIVGEVTIRNRRFFLFEKLL